MLLSELEYNVENLNKIINMLSNENQTANMRGHVKRWSRVNNHIFQKFGQQLKIEREVQGTLSEEQISKIIYHDFIRKIESDPKFSLVTIFFQDNIVTPEEIGQNYLNETLTFFGTKFNAGMKISRILPRLVPKSESDFVQVEYSKIVQKFSFTGTAVLSIDPVDYITMSENQSGWRSCHALDGEFRTGTLAYMLDYCSVVGYVKTKDVPIGGTWYSDKIWRQMVLIGEDYAVQSRQYPNSNSFNAGTISQMLIDIFGENYSVHKKNVSDLGEVVENIETDNGTRLWYNDIYENSFSRGRIVMPDKYESIGDLYNSESFQHLYVGVEKIPCACGCSRDLESAEWIYYESSEDDEDYWDEELEEE
jgi:hypothetical protein